MKSLSATKPRKTPARQRLMDAAARVFAREGLEGSTTRGIAREAGVNEVTLFRLFKTKENLVAAVVGQTFDDEPAGIKPRLPKPTGDLLADLTAYAKLYESTLTANIGLIRTMVGEIHHHRSQERKVAMGIFRPLREEVITRLQLAQKRGHLRPGLDLALTADLLNGMIFTGVLRRCSLYKLTEYSAKTYLNQCVAVFIQGITSKEMKP